MNQQPSALVQHSPTEPAAVPGFGFAKRPTISRTNLVSCSSQISEKPIKTTEEMLYDDLAKTLVLLELEDETDQAESTGEVHSSSPSLASSLCSLSVNHDDDHDFALSERATKVAFSTVSVRQYAITIGDHPCCSTGYPMCLDWQYDVLPEQSLDSFEANHEPRRSRLELITTYEERKTRLEEYCSQNAKRLNRRLERHKCRNRNVAAFFTP